MVKKLYWLDQPHNELIQSKKGREREKKVWECPVSHGFGARSTPLALVHPRWSINAVLGMNERMLGEKLTAGKDCIP